MSPGLVEHDDGLGDSTLEPVAICGMGKKTRLSRRHPTQVAFGILMITNNDEL